MTSEVMANGTKEKWDPGEPERHRHLFFFVIFITIL